MNVNVTKSATDGCVILLWPAFADGDEKYAPTHEMGEADVRLLLRWHPPLSGPYYCGRGRRLAMFRWADLAPLLQEMDG